jgi:hypothetical protein
MTKKELRKLCRTPDWRWSTSEGAELHTLLLGLLCPFREKLEWLEDAETLALNLRAGRRQSKTALSQRPRSDGKRLSH